MKRLNSGALIALILVLVVGQVACSTSTFVTDLGKVATAVQDGVAIAGAAGVIPPAAATIINAGITCIDGAAPILQAGGNVGTMAQGILTACEAAAAAVIPGGTDAALAAKLEGIVSAAAGFLKAFNVSVAGFGAHAANPAATATTQVWKPSSADLAALSKIRANVPRKIASASRSQISRSLLAETPPCGLIPRSCCVDPCGHECLLQPASCGF